MRLFDANFCCQGRLAASNMNCGIKRCIHTDENTNLLVLNQQGNLIRNGTRFLVMNELKDRVLKRRKQLGLTQKELAKRVGVKQQSIQQLEDGVVKRPRYLLELSSALECDAHWLSTGKGSADFNLSDRPYIPGSGSPNSPAKVPTEFLALLSKASPRSHKQLMHIAEAAAEGRLTDADINLLTQIADRLAAKE